MIKILHRYIIRNITLATSLIAVTIAGVVFILTMLGELKNIGDGDYGFFQAFICVFMRMPSEIYHFMPLLVLLGSVLGLSILYSHREMIVMRASGFSVNQILLSVLMGATLIVLIMSLIGEWAAPHLNHSADMRKEYAKNAGQAVVTASGVWFHIGHDFIHARHVVGAALLEGVTRYQFDEKHHLLAAYYTKKLVYENHEWVMYDAVKTSFYHDRTHSESIPKAVWDVKFNSNLLNTGIVDSSAMTLPRLAKFAKYLERNGLRSSEYRFEFWQRVFQPFAALIMVFLAIPFVLGTLTSMTLGLRMLVGMLVGFTFFISNALLAQLCIVFQIPPVLAAFLPILLFLFMGLYFAKRLTK